MQKSVAQVRARRKALSWIPTALVALFCLAFVVITIVVQNSWWAEDEPTASADQKATDGMSLFTDAGVDFLAKDGTLRVRIGPDSLSATELGLPSDGTRTIDPIVPVQAITLAPDGPLYLELVRSFTLTTENDRVVSVAYSRDDNGAWSSVSGTMARDAMRWGWTEADLSALQEELTAAARDTTTREYGASLPEIASKGALVSVDVNVSLDASSAAAVFVVRSAED